MKAMNSEGKEYPLEPVVPYARAHFWWVSTKGTCMGALGIRWRVAEQTMTCRSCGRILSRDEDWGDHALSPDTFAEWKLWKAWDDAQKADRARLSKRS